MSRSRWILLSGALATALAVVGLASGRGFTAPRTVNVSGLSQFSGCTVGGPGTNFVNSEVEPFVAVNPANPANIVSVFQQDRWSNGGAHGLVASASHDGGATWSESFAHFGICSGGTAANGGDYDRVSDPWVSFAPNGDVYQIALSASADLTVSAVLVSKSADGGDTWAVPRDILAVNQNEFTIGNQIAVLPNGTLVDVFEDFNGSGRQPSPNQFHESVIVSSDKGLTWSRPIDVSTDGAVAVRDPDTGAGVRAGAGLPDIAVDPRNGTLYVVWSDGRFSGFARDDVALSRSTDGGRTWSNPIKVNASPSGVAAFTPSVDVSEDGTVAVSYYDFRNNTPDPSTLPTDEFVVRSHDGGLTFGSEVRATKHSFDLDLAPRAGGLFLGDYVGLAHAGTTFVSLF